MSDHVLPILKILQSFPISPTRQDSFCSSLNCYFFISASLVFLVFLNKSSHPLQAFVFAFPLPTILFSCFSTYFIHLLPQISTIIALTKISLSTLQWNLHPLFYNFIFISPFLFFFLVLVTTTEYFFFCY